MRFADLGVREEIVRALAEQGIENAFAIQELTLPLALAGDDLIGQARTGMGKTFAFGVPLLHSITTGAAADRPLDGTPRALIVVPTRELCMQVHDDLAGAAKYLRTDGGRPLSVISIYGGRPYESQIESLQAGADVVVGTPGRLLDLAQQGHLRLGGLSVLVLDEADEMLDLGFLPDIERILRQIPAQRQAMLFSATMPDPIITLARTFMTQPTHIRAEGVQGSATHDTTEQFAYRAHALDKVEMVSRILQAESRGATMIFTRTKRTAQKVSDELAERGFKVGAVHGDLGQIAREKSLKAFRTGEIDVLVATDVAARGIDIDDVTHVINYQIPEDEQAYVHRIGRTGRAGKTGVAVTLIDWDELERWSMINTALTLDRPDPAAVFVHPAFLLGAPEADEQNPAARCGDLRADLLVLLGGKRPEWGSVNKDHRQPGITHFQVADKVPGDLACPAEDSDGNLRAGSGLAHTQCQVRPVNAWLAPHPQQAHQPHDRHAAWSDQLRLVDAPAKVGAVVTLHHHVYGSFAHAT